MPAFAGMVAIFGVEIADFLVRVIVAAVILLGGFVVGKILEKLCHRGLEELELDKSLRKAGVRIALEEGIAHFVKYLTYFIAVIWALAELGLSTVVLSIVFIGAIVLTIVAILLALKDFIPNAFAGYMIYRNKLFKKGDRIKLNGVEGKIEKVGIAETIVKNGSDMIYVPNSFLIKKVVRVRKQKKAKQ